MYLSVIICTHNPRPDYLRRVLEGLRAQTLPKEQWELLLIDNASTEPLAGNSDLSWHPQARHILEEELGLTPSRLRGINESVGEFVLFVDDDNVLNPTYLESSKSILEKMPWLGAIGGQILPEYETQPPDWLVPVERVLAIRRADVPRWSNAVDDWKAQPWGAGMVLRREVCNKYVNKLHNDDLRKQLDRKGTSLFSGGDTDFVLTSLELDLGFGVFPELIVTHLIPAQRMTKEYILRIQRGLIASNLWLAHIRGDNLNIPERKTLYTEVRRFYHFVKRSRFSKDLEKSVQAGYQDFLALTEINSDSGERQS